MNTSGINFQTAWSRALLLCLALMSTTEGVQAVGHVDDSCAKTTFLELGGTLRSPGQFSEDRDYYDVFVPSPGYVTLDVAVPADAIVEPNVAFLGRLCHDGSRGEVSFVARHTQGMVFFVNEPGTYTFAVEAQDPVLSLGEYKVRTGFAGERRELYDKIAEGEPDIEPDGNTPESNTAESEPDPEPEGWVISGSPPRPGALPSHAASQACHRAEGDDHGDTLLCATSLSLGSKATGELRNAWGDDDDFFWFDLTFQRRVQITSDGGNRTIGTLYDRHGHRLAVADNPGDGNGFRMVKTLGAGRYFVRVSGEDEAGGGYSLTATTLDR